MVFVEGGEVGLLACEAIVFCRVWWHWFPCCCRQHFLRANTPRTYRWSLNSSSSSSSNAACRIRIHALHPFSRNAQDAHPGGVLFYFIVFYCFKTPIAPASFRFCGRAGPAGESWGRRKLRRQRRLHSSLVGGREHQAPAASQTTELVVVALEQQV